MSTALRPYRLEIDQEAIDDLHARLARTRLPDQPRGQGWECGTELSWLVSLIDHWRTRFDWRAEERRLNAFPQFLARISGIDLHFLHVEGKGPNPLPLLLGHGWPGSVFEFLELIPRLTDPARFGGSPDDSFTVIAPSLPGFGLSFQPGQPRFSVEQISECFLELMVDVLGHQRFGVQGGDWGASVGTRMALSHPARLLGLHLNFLPLPRDPAAIGDGDPALAGYREQLRHWLTEDAAYASIQGTRPQTLAYGLTDSPAGLAAWIAEKMRAWSDCHGDVEQIFSKDQLLANISLYWFTGAIGSSFWPYYARAHGAWPVPSGKTIDVPLGYCEFPAEILKPPRAIAGRTYSNIHRWSVMPNGGHFAAMEQPQALAREVREFFRPLRNMESA